MNGETSDRTPIDGISRMLMISLLIATGVVGAGSSQAIHWVQRSQESTSEWSEIRQRVVESTAASSHAAGAVTSLLEAIRELRTANTETTKLAVENARLVTQLSEQQRGTEARVTAIEQRTTQELRDINDRLAEMYNKLMEGKRR